jgi:hypothetical protein
MRFFVLGMVLMAVAEVSGAAPVPPPILGRVIGGVGENGETLPGVSKRCFIYPNQAIIQTYDSATGKNDSWAQPLNLTATYLRQVSAALLAAEKSREVAGQHVRETVPHVYYFGYATRADGVAGDRIRLFFDGARRIQRQGTETPYILQVIEHLCPHR